MVWNTLQINVCVFVRSHFYILNMFTHMVYIHRIHQYEGLQVATTGQTLLQVLVAFTVVGTVLCVEPKVLRIGAHKEIFTTGHFGHTRKNEQLWVIE